MAAFLKLDPDESADLAHDILLAAGSAADSTSARHAAAAATDAVVAAVKRAESAAGAARASHGKGVSMGADSSATAPSRHALSHQQDRAAEGATAALARPKAAGKMAGDTCHLGSRRLSRAGAPAAGQAKKPTTGPPSRPRADATKAVTGAIHDGAAAIAADRTYAGDIIKDKDEHDDLLPRPLFEAERL